MRNSLLIITAIISIVVIVLCVQALIALNANLATSVNLSRNLKHQNDLIARESAAYREKLRVLEEKVQAAQKEDASIQKKAADELMDRSVFDAMIAEQQAKLSELEKALAAMKDSEEGVFGEAGAISAAEAPDTVYVEPSIVEILPARAWNEKQASASMKRPAGALSRTPERAQKAEGRGRKSSRSPSEKEKLIYEIADLHYNLGIILTKKGDFKRAVDEFEQALKVNPNDAASHYNLAILYDEKFNDTARSAEHQRLYRQLKTGDEENQKIR